MRRVAKARCVPILFRVPVTKVRLMGSLPTREIAGLMRPMAKLSKGVPVLGEWRLRTMKMASKSADAAKRREREERSLE